MGWNWQLIFAWKIDCEHQGACQLLAYMACGDTKSSWIVWMSDRICFVKGIAGYIKDHNIYKKFMLLKW